MRRIIKYSIGRISTFFNNIRYRNKGFNCAGVMYHCDISISGKGNSIIIAKGSRLNNVKIDISGYNNRLVIEEKTIINGSGRIRIEDSNNIIRIGKQCDIQSVFLSVADKDTSIDIGDNCLLSAEVIIRTSDSHSILSCSTGKRVNPGKSVIIGERVWVGYGANILKGTEIGNDCIVGTHALVSGLKAKSNTIIAGMPAKIVKENVKWIKKRI